MSARFTLAEAEEIDAVIDLIESRIVWMDEKGIQLWNTTDYLTVYPRSYFEEAVRNRKLFVMKRDETILAAAVLYERDPRWKDGTEVSAYYVHHLASRLDCPGAGSLMLEELEKKAMEDGKVSMRLDCGIDNTFLNSYYESRGYVRKGTCVDGPYEGILREKLLQSN
ncbi:MAG: GNAT family N-acetyltransferase [Solobacterium sp.]|nr:GNAT family N-acetyltransferase [Solobacterium sp.]